MNELDICQAAGIIIAFGIVCVLFWVHPLVMFIIGSIPCVIWVIGGVILKVLDFDSINPFVAAIALMFLVCLILFIIILLGKLWWDYLPCFYGGRFNQHCHEQWDNRRGYPITRPYVRKRREHGGERHEHLDMGSKKEQEGAGKEDQKGGYMVKGFFWIISLATAIFFGLKLINILDWGWFWVFSPLWMSGILLLLLGAILYLGIKSLLRKGENKNEG